MLSSSISIVGGTLSSRRIQDVIAGSAPCLVPRSGVLAAAWPDMPLETLYGLVWAAESNQGNQLPSQGINRWPSKIGRKTA
jgi:hypothetical protein